MGMSSSGGNNRSSRTTLSEINVTPLVDVMLVLLIIFMITTPMLHQGLNVKLPETAASGLEVKDAPFILTIRRDNQVYVDKQPLAFNTLRSKLAAIFQVRSDKQIFIEADKDVSYGFVAAVMAEIKAAGITNVGLVTIPKSR